MDKTQALPFERLRFYARNPRTNRQLYIATTDAAGQPVQVAEPTIRELADAIRESGRLRPLLVLPVGRGHATHYEIVGGSRRYRAICLLRDDASSRHRQLSIAGGLPFELVPCEVLPQQTKPSDVEVLGVLDNLHRRDNSFWEFATACDRIIQSHGVSRRELARRLGVSYPTVTRAVQWHRQACDEIREFCERGGDVPISLAFRWLVLTPEHQEKEFTEWRLGAKQTQPKQDERKRAVSVAKVRRLYETAQERGASRETLGVLELLLGKRTRLPPMGPLPKRKRRA